MHDLNLSGWYFPLYLLSLIPLFKYIESGNIIQTYLIIPILSLCLVPGTKEKNKYGSAPE